MGASLMAFNLADYGQSIKLAGGDFLAEFVARGGRRGSFPEDGHLNQPDIIRETAEAFVDAGAEILVTMTDAANTAASAAAIESSELTVERLHAVNREAARLCRAAFADLPDRVGVVFGAIGPCERLLSLGEIEEVELRDAYRTQAQALAEGGVDAILCRCFVELDALRAAVEAAAESTGLPIIAGMTFDCGPDYTETTMGVTVPQACEVLAGLGAAMVGCDRGEYPDTTAATVALMRASSDLPIWVEINAGRPELLEGSIVYPEPPADFGRRLGPLAAAGANIIGGGLGASADHIGQLARARAQFLRSRPTPPDRSGG